MNDEPERMTRGEFLEMLLTEEYELYSNSSKESEAQHHNRMMQIAKLLDEEDKRTHELRVLEMKSFSNEELEKLKFSLDMERHKAEERSKNIDRGIHVAEIAAGTGASIYGANKMVKMFKTINEFEKNDILTSDSSKHLIKYIFSKDGLMGKITKLLK